MVQEQNRGEDRFMDEMVNDLGGAYEREKPPRRSFGSPNLASRTALGVLAGAGILVFLLLVIFFRPSGGASKQEFAELKSALEKMEMRMDQMEGMESRINKRILGLEQETKKQFEALASREKAILQEARPAPPAPAPAVPAQPTKEKHHTVRQGESLYSIARKYGMTVQELCRMNNINARTPIQPGQKLLVGS